MLNRVSNNVNVEFRVPSHQMCNRISGNWKIRAEGLNHGYTLAFKGKNEGNNWIFTA